MQGVETDSHGLWDSHVDHAIDLALAGDDEGAVAWAGARLRQGAAAHPTALLLTARELVKVGRHEVGIKGLRASCQRSIEAGNLPMAVVACCELRDAGEDPSASLDEVARAFCRGSGRLIPRAALPPSLPAPGAPVDPLPLSTAKDDACELVESAIRQLAATPISSPGFPPQPLFSALDRTGLRAMIGIFESTLQSPGNVLIEQGTTGSEAFVVARGELDVLRRGRDGSSFLLARLGSGALLGEMALLSRAPRAADVVVRRPSIVLVARQTALDTVATEQPQVGIEFAAHCRGRMLTNLVRTSPLFGAIEPSERLSLMYRFVTRTFEPGQALITQGQESDGLHLLASGEVEVIHREDAEPLQLAELGVGEVVGEMGLVLRKPASADVIARTPTVTLYLPRDGFLDLVKEHPTLLSKLYEIAVKRDQETSTILAQEATVADDYVIL